MAPSYRITAEAIVRSLVVEKQQREKSAHALQSKPLVTHPRCRERLEALLWLRSLVVPLLVLLTRLVEVQ